MSAPVPAPPRRCLDDYRTEPPADDAEPRRCPRHPEESSVYVAIPVLSLEGSAPHVRGWTCKRCWTARGFAVDRRRDDAWDA